MGYFKAGRAMQNFQQNRGGSVIPVPMNFEKGIGIVVMSFLPGSSSGNGPGLFDQISVLTVSGKSILLFPPENPAASETLRPADAAPPGKPAGTQPPAPPTPKPSGR